jgi:hypothetical protein
VVGGGWIEGERGGGRDAGDGEAPAGLIVKVAGG